MIFFVQHCSDLAHDLGGELFQLIFPVAPVELRREDRFAVFNRDDGGA